MSIHNPRKVILEENRNGSYSDDPYENFSPQRYNFNDRQVVSEQYNNIDNPPPYNKKFDREFNQEVNREVNREVKQERKYEKAKSIAKYLGWTVLILFIVAIIIMIIIYMWKYYSNNNINNTNNGNNGNNNTNNGNSNNNLPCGMDLYVSMPSNGLGYTCQQDALGNFNGIEQKQIVAGYPYCPQYEYMYNTLCSCDSHFTEPQILNSSNQLVPDYHACQVDSTTGLWTGKLVWTNNNPSNNLCQPKTTLESVCSCNSSSYDNSQPLMCLNDKQVLQPLPGHKCPVKFVTNNLCDSNNISNYVLATNNNLSGYLETKSNNTGNKSSACNYNLGKLEYTWKNPSNLIQPTSYPNRTFSDNLSVDNTLCKCSNMCKKGKICSRDGYVHWDNPTGTTSTTICPDFCKSAETTADTGTCTCDSTNGHQLISKICIHDNLSANLYEPSTLNSTNDYCYKFVDSAGICQTNSDPNLDTNPRTVNYCSAYQVAAMQINTNNLSEVCFPNASTLAANCGNYNIFTGNANLGVPNTNIDLTGNLVLSSFHFASLPVSTTSQPIFFYLTTTYRSNPQTILKLKGNADGPYVLTDTTILPSNNPYTGKWWTPVDESYMSGISISNGLKKYQLWMYDGVKIVNHGTNNILSAILISSSLQSYRLAMTPMATNNNSNIQTIYNNLSGYLETKSNNIQTDTINSNFLGTIYFTSSTTTSFPSQKIVDNGFNQTNEISLQPIASTTTILNNNQSQFYFIIPKQ
jgi:hypothetical protein